jgi:hypothetical protein
VLLRGVVTHRYAAALAAVRFEAFKPKAAKGRRLRLGVAGLSRRPHCARVGLCRARAQEAGLPSRDPKTNTARSERETALSRSRTSVSQRAKRQLRELEDAQLLVVLRKQVAVAAVRADAEAKRDDDADRSAAHESHVIRAEIEGLVAAGEGVRALRPQA